MPLLGRLLGAAVLRERRKTRRYLPCLHAGLKTIPRERRRLHDHATQRPYSSNRSRQRPKPA
ncbi:DUF1612 domain-containing protein [Bradyrhizobium sp. YR681]|uniref:DUF1612 domain-containing protein n=1 Tax=Bradyrhizobium sp. YR681 TaxID=1144344 RepID=UPI00201B84CF|nr:DUF1612 domain-containing protein [Bradyrhizobium sp. YR681]